MKTGYVYGKQFVLSSGINSSTSINIIFLSVIVQEFKVESIVKRRRIRLLCVVSCRAGCDVHGVTERSPGPIEYKGTYRLEGQRMEALCTKKMKQLDRNEEMFINAKYDRHTAYC
jgi:hypothetical protein